MEDTSRQQDVTDGHNQALAERFEEHRIRLRAVAYRLLGSLSEAEDAVQEAWLRGGMPCKREHRAQPRAWWQRRRRIELL
jgi:DNA-directed RNA polymerase specialized sigma24 family protein